MAPGRLIAESRTGSKKQHQFAALLRQPIYSRLAGDKDVNDGERLSVDPAVRHVVGDPLTPPLQTCLRFYLAMNS